MNKLLKSIVAASVGIAMVIGVGVGVASRESKAAYATDNVVSFTTGSNTVAIKVNYNSAGAPASNNGVRMGTSNNAGSATFSIPAGTTTFGFYAVGWNGKETTASVSASVGTITDSTADLTSNSSASGTINANATVAITETEANTKKEFSISGVTSSSTITLTTSGSNKRLIAWDAYYVTADKTLSAIEVNVAPTKTTYYAGETFDPTGLVISRKYSDNTSDTYSYAGHTSDFTFNPDLSTALTTSNVSVTIGYGEKTCSQAITVNPARTLSSISISEYTTTFNQGDSFEFGGTVTANYSNSTTADVTLSAAFSGYNMTETGTQTITVSYTEGGVTKTATYSITIKAISSVTFVGGTDKGSTTGNNSQDEVIKSGIRMHCSDGAFATAEYRFYSGSILTFSSTIGNMKSISFSPASSNGDLSKLSLDSESPGSFTSSTGTWSGVSETVIFHLSAQVRATEVVIELGDVAKTLVSISVSDETTSFEVNDTFAFGGIVTATYDDDSTKDVTSNATFTGYDMSTAGNQTVTVSYTEGDETKTATYNISVVPAEEGYLLDGSEAGSGNAYAGSNTSTQNGISWVINGNVTTNPWRIGGKSITDQNRYIYSTTVLQNDIKRVDITFGNASGITVNSLSLDVYSEEPDGDSEGGDVAENLTATFSANSRVSISKEDNSSWANCYYRIKLNVTVAGNDNKFVEFKSAKFVYATPSSPAQQVENKESYAKLSYDYEKAGSGVIDVLNNANTINNPNATTYSSWSYVSSSNITYKGNTAGKGGTIQLRNNDEHKDSGIVVTSSDLLAKKITIKWNSSTTDGQTIQIYGANSEYTDPTDLHGTNPGTLIGELSYNATSGEIKEISISDDYSYIGITSKAGAQYLDSILVQWGEISYTHKDVAIRFGGSISKSLWTDLNNSGSAIEGYGLLLSTPEKLGEDSLKTKYNVATSAGPDFKKFDMAVATKAPVDGGDNWYWNLYKVVTSGLTQEYVAVAYIRLANGDVIFMKEVTASAKSAATNLINDTYDLESFDGSLANLACK